MLLASAAKKGAGIDAQGQMGFTPLHYASMSGDRKGILVLLEAGARTDIRGYGMTARRMAQRCRPDIAGLPR